MEESDSGQQQKRCRCGFFGSAQTSGLCSKCFKATVQTDKSQDPKAEIMRNKEHSRVSPYSSHDQVSTSSSSNYFDISSSSSAANNKDSVMKTSSTANNIDSVIKISPANNQDSVIKTAAASDTNIKQSVDSSSADKSETKATTDCLVEASTSNTSDNGTVSKETVQASDTTIAISEKDKPLVKDGELENRGVKRDSSVLDEPSSTPEKIGAKSKKRCGVCKCKLELAQRAIGRCKCDNVYCSLHRLPEQHDCQFDHKEDGRREAREKMVKPTRHLGTSFKRLDSDS